MRTLRFITLSLGLLLAVADDARAVAVQERLSWAHPTLDLHLWSVSEIDGQAALEFCVTLKPHADRGTARAGYPRYRMRHGLWRDAVTRWPRGRREDLSVSRGATERQCLLVFLPHGATQLRWQIDRETLRLGVDRWMARLGAEPPPPPSLPPLQPIDAQPPGVPARLKAALRWDGGKPFVDGALDAGESGDLVIDVFNEGARRAEGVRVRVLPGEIPAVDFAGELPVPAIDPGSVQTVRLPFRGEPELADGVQELTVVAREPYGHDAPPLVFELVTRGAPGAELVLTDDFAIEGHGLPVPRDTIITVRLRVRNVGQGASRSAAARVSAGENVFAAHDSAESFDLGDLAPGDLAEITYRCYANQRARQMTLHVELWDKRTAAQPSTTLVALPLENAPGVARIVRVQPDPRAETILPPAPPPLTSDVDRYVPRSTSARPDALAVVLGVEQYTSAPVASFAAQDARTAARYFEHALGIPAERLQFLVDEEVTLAQLHRIFGRDGWLARRVHEQTEVFVYFSGHGVAELEVFVPYLLPVDGDPNYIQQTAYPLDRLIEGLAALDARKATLFLDTCFGGRTREGASVLGDARPLVVVPARHHVSGVSVFSAARGNQVASALVEEGHGLFSYSLFKGLGGAADLNDDRRVIAAELQAYLMEVVPRAAAGIDREQTPSIFLEDETQILVQLP